MNKSRIPVPRFAAVLSGAVLLAVSCSHHEDPISGGPEVPSPVQQEVKAVLRYTSTDGLAVRPSNPAAFGAEILSNEYKDGEGTISFGDDVTVIGDRAFKGCTSLKGIDLSDIRPSTKAGETSSAGSITSIGTSAFEGCTGLLDITIPSSVTSIGDAAFKGCTAMRSMNLLSRTPPALGKGVLDDTDCPIIVPSGAESEYDGAAGWSAYGGQINGALPEPELIDLGLPSGLKWASCNLGAVAPQETGLYLAWAETKTKDEGYHWLNYKYGTNIEVSKYNNTDGHVVLDAGDDAATVYLGEKWRMPTSAELQELVDNCNWSMTTLGGKAGYQGKSKINGQTIFLPACGQVEGGMDYGIFGEGEYGFYWSSELGTVATDACYMVFYEGVINLSKNFRAAGYQVRPVQGDLIGVESVSVDRPSLEISKGEPGIINATLSPAGASLKSVLWSSSNEDCVVVSARSGRLVGRTIGSATITATTADGGFTAKCQVTVKNPSYPVPDAIDLGLPSGLKWGTFNLGASKPEEFGVYFAWGETEPNGMYTEAAYSLCDGNLLKLKKYVVYPEHGTVDGLTTLEASDDAASVILKGTWRMPAKEDFQELLDHCDCTAAKENGVAGYRFTSKNNGRSIFLPAAGSGMIGRTGLTGDSAGHYCLYWSSSLTQEDPGYRQPDYMAVCLAGYGADTGNQLPGLRTQNARYTGMTIRPVTN